MEWCFVEKIRQVFQVLYQMFKKFTLIGADKLITIDYIAGGVSFFVIGLGGAAIGLVYAIIVSFITKYVPILPHEERTVAVGIFGKLRGNEIYS